MSEEVKAEDSEEGSEEVKAEGSEEVSEEQRGLQLAGSLLVAYLSVSQELKSASMSAIFAGHPEARSADRNSRREQQPSTSLARERRRLMTRVL